MRLSFAQLLIIAVAFSPVTLVGQETRHDRVEQLTEVMTPATYCATPGITDRSFWTRVGSHEHYRAIVEAARQTARRDPTLLPDELYLEYSRNGNRSRYQRVFFDKLDDFRQLVVAECIENKGAFLPAIEKMIASYAVDKTWVLPAHDSGNENFEGRRITIDLFASEVACDLANADHILGERLSHASRKSIRQEAERRIFEPYRQTLKDDDKQMWWLTGTNNWNAVCLANVTGTAFALLESPDDRAFFAANAEQYITYFLNGFTDDGYCSEGIGYWNYGYGCFVRLSHLLSAGTTGHINLLSSPKAKSAGLFARRVEITSGQYPAFADCSVGSRPSRRIMSYVSRYYDLAPTAWEISGYSDLRWLDEFGIFSFIFAENTDGRTTATLADHDWFKDAGILICRQVGGEGEASIGVALKGGHNAEHHNHNDVGSYVYCIGDMMPLVDPGAEEYTRRTFSSRRYDSNVLNSFGHPVPRVAGQLQSKGRQAAGEVLTIAPGQQTDQLVLDLTSAYDVPSLKKLHRSFTFSRRRGTLEILDDVQFTSPQTFGTALVTFGEWRMITPNQLTVDAGPRSVLVTIDAGEHPVTFDAVLIDEDVRGGKQPTRIGIDLAEPVASATVRLTIQPVQ